MKMKCDKTSLCMYIDKKLYLKLQQKKVSKTITNTCNHLKNINFVLHHVSIFVHLLIYMHKCAICEYINIVHNKQIVTDIKTFFIN